MSHCATADHGAVPATGVVVLTDCDEGSCTGHPYCTPCIDTLLTDPYNTLVEDRRPQKGEVPDIIDVEGVDAVHALRLLADRLAADPDLILIGLWNVEAVDPAHTALQVVVTHMVEES